MKQTVPHIYVKVSAKSEQDNSPAMRCLNALTKLIPEPVIHVPIVPIFALHSLTRNLP